MLRPPTNMHLVGMQDQGMPCFQTIVHQTQHHTGTFCPLNPLQLRGLRHGNCHSNKHAYAAVSPPAPANNMFDHRTQHTEVLGV
jgi:hypothetical protein